MRHQEEARVAAPQPPKRLVEHQGLFAGLRAGGVPSLDVVAAGRRALEEYDRVVARKLVRVGRVHGSKEVVGLPRPVGGAIDGPAITEQDALRVQRALHVLQVSLHVKDGGLRRIGAPRARRPGESPR